MKLQAYSEAAHLDSFIFHAGDQKAELEGARLDEVSKVEWEGVSFSPDGLKRVDGKDELTLSGTGGGNGVEGGGQGGFARDPQRRPRDATGRRGRAAKAKGRAAQQECVSHSGGSALSDPLEQSG